MLSAPVALVLLACLLAGMLHAATPEHDHPFRQVALRREAGGGAAVSWALIAGGIHLGTSAVIAWLCYHAGVGLLAAGGPPLLFAVALAWVTTCSVLVGWGRFTGHLQSPRTSLLRLEERRMKALSPSSLTSIEGLNPCLLPWGLWVAAAPAGLGWCLSAAALWSLGVTGTAVAKLLLRFPRHPRPWLGPVEKRGDLLAGLVAASSLVLAYLSSRSP